MSWVAVASLFAAVACLAWIAAMFSQGWFATPKKDELPNSPVVSNQSPDMQEFVLPLLDDGLDDEIEDIDRALNEIEIHDLDFENGIDDEN